MCLIHIIIINMAANEESNRPTAVYGMVHINKRLIHLVKVQQQVLPTIDRHLGQVALDL